jgi:hypothetical protein
MISADLLEVQDKTNESTDTSQPEKVANVLSSEILRSFEPVLVNHADQ